MTATDDQGESRSIRRPRIRGWFVVLVTISLAAVYFYHLYRQQQEIFVNSHYFRTLQEVASELNTKLEQLERLHKYNESDSTKASIFPTYKAEAAASPTDGSEQGPDLSPGEASHRVADSESCEEGGTAADTTGDYRYTLGANRVRIEQRGVCGDPDRVYTVDVADVLPTPRNDFVLYIIADSANRVLSSTGGTSGLSIIDTEVISRAVQMRDSQDWLKLAAQQHTATPDSSKPLPGYSTYIDLELTTGKSRLLIQPFRLHPTVSIAGDAATGGQAAPLYLIGVQPNNVIRSYENRRWNLSLLLLSLVALVFLWTVTRLLMLSRHQPLGNSFYRTVIASAYLTFVLLLSLLVSLGERDSHIALNQERAAQLLEKIDRAVEGELYEVFVSLAPYQNYYACLLDPAACAEREASAVSDGACPLTRLPGCTGCDRDAKGEPSLLIARGSDLSLASPGDAAAWSNLCRDLPPASGFQGSAISKFSKINVFGPGARVEVKGRASDKTGLEAWHKGQPVTARMLRREVGKVDVAEWYEVANVAALPASGKLLSVFVMNDSGQQVLPMFFYTENNKPPTSYALAHRDYFRRVRDQAGWNATFRAGGRVGDDSPATSPCEGDCGPLLTCRIDGGDGVTVSNFYMQRLLNINTGTRGTTLGLPLQVQRCGARSGSVGAGFVLGADIDLPSLSYAQWWRRDLPQDMVVMVVDRESGQVIYHLDDDRAMVENLYHAGQGALAISRDIRAGRLTGRRISGFYHGQAGSYLAQTLPVDQWALVAFVPDASADSLMTNVFLATAGSLCGVLLLLVLAMYLLRQVCDPQALKRRLGVPEALDRHWLMLFISIFLAAGYFGFRMGSIRDHLAMPQILGLDSAVFLSALAMMLVTLWGYLMLGRLRQPGPGRGPAIGIVGLLLALVILGTALVGYLQRVGSQPSASINRWYSGKLYHARLNQEAQELRELALTRYPNSIKLHQRAPASLLPVSSRWLEPAEGGSQRDRFARGGADKEATNPGGAVPVKVLPEAVGTFSQYTASTGSYDWLMRYLLGLRGGAAEEEAGSADRAQKITAERLPRFLTVMTLGFISLCCLWYFLDRWIIRALLVGPPGLIEHLRHIISHNVPERAYAPRRRLVLDLHCERHAGMDLAPLLRSLGAGETTRRGVLLMLEACPWLKDEAAGGEHFSGVNVSFDTGAPAGVRRNQPQDASPRLSIHLSDLDICLARAELRAPLLRLIRELKTLALSGELAEFRLSMGFHSYEALLLKAHTLASERDPMSGAEFANWAETLMDFTVDLPAGLTDEIDAPFVVFECEASGLLRGLSRELAGDAATPPPSWRQRRRWLSLRDGRKTGREWASINCILLRAGALFRHKWETCSSAEKLALYYLARHKRINTGNAQLLEQLALQGLIRVDRDRIRIVNNSFAYFARHAEDTATLKQLVQVGEVGVWKEYRLPVTLVILLLLGAIALTSGSSLYLIVASLLGLLGTIFSLASSAHMIRENLR